MHESQFNALPLMVNTCVKIVMNFASQIFVADYIDRSDILNCITDFNVSSSIIKLLAGKGDERYLFKSTPL